MRASKRIILTILLLTFSKISEAYDRLPYSTRTHSFSAWSTTAQGDIRTVGMSGATVGLGDTFIASLDNPSGLAMALNGADSNFASSHIYDRNIQNYDNYFVADNFGVAFNNYPWGFSVGWVGPYAEGQPYLTPATPLNPVDLNIYTTELHLSVARLFFENRLSVGASVILGQSTEEVSSTPTLSAASSHSYALGANIGTTYQLPNHFLAGFSYTPATHYAGSTDSHFTPALPNFFQPLDEPWRLGFGTGWIPNRFFRADFTTFIVGSTQGTALLRDDSLLVGENLTIQPKLGFAYIFLDYKELKGTAFAGTYFETSRIQNTDSRIHETVGVEVKPWIFSLGWGLDNATGYKNYLFSFGIDVFNVMAKLEIIPTAWHPPYEGFAPKPMQVSDEGLPRAMVKNWRPRGPDMDPIKIGLAIPKNLEIKADEFTQSVEEGAKKIGQGIVDLFSPTSSQAQEEETQKKPIRHHKRKKTKPKKKRHSPS